MSTDPTHHIPEELQAKLLEAKHWKNERQVMIDANFPDPGAWSQSVAEGNLLLAEIVDLCDQAWGFA